MSTHLYITDYLIRQRIFLSFHRICCTTLICQIEAMCFENINKKNGHVLLPNSMSSGPRNVGYFMCSNYATECSHSTNICLLRNKARDEAEDIQQGGEASSSQRTQKSPNLTQVQLLLMVTDALMIPRETLIQHDVRFGVSA